MWSNLAGSCVGQCTRVNCLDDLRVVRRPTTGHGGLLSSDYNAVHFPFHIIGPANLAVLYANHSCCGMGQLCYGPIYTTHRPPPWLVACQGYRLFNT